MSLSNAIQRAIFERLVASPAVAAIVAGRVYDAPPSTVQAPYITFGPSDVVFDDMACISGRIETVQIDCWSEAQDGKREVKALSDAVAAALHDYEATLTVGRLVLMEVVAVRVMDDPSGAHHGVITVECTAEA